MVAERPERTSADTGGRNELGVLLRGFAGRPPCAEQPELWYAEDAASRARAIAQCSRCRIWEPCREAGRAGREYGIWGGETEAGRAAAGHPPAIRNRSGPHRVTGTRPGRTGAQQPPGTPGQAA
ncbi:WhiB family transcriptional regulator [Streptomyces sp. NPDC001262]|uniref:WhiB family transcriptional regulator n=1 Tax=unclassified Streptomyces TaxID=2593676 RepID=UPI0036A2C3A0